MLYFENDYSEGAHQKVMERLLESNMEKLPGYGGDFYCESAKEKIRKACGCPGADIYFLSGGTQTNAAVISSLLKSYEGVISASTGHVSTHEAGAIEFTGHKVLEVSGHDGKIQAEELKACLKTFYEDTSHEHMVFPGMVYLSHPTEYGTLYSRKELSDIAKICAEYQIPLYLDGARLGYGLVSEGTDVTLSDIADLTDVFYIGGTKVGALCGEAVVFTGKAPAHFLTSIKQRGALLAKGRLLGVQFDALFTDDLYLQISRNATETAKVLRRALEEKGYPFFVKSTTNQIFVVLENEKLRQLQEKVRMSIWEKTDKEHTVVRFATSWATGMEDVQELIALL